MNRIAATIAIVLVTSCSGPAGTTPDAANPEPASTEDLRVIEQGIDEEIVGIVANAQRTMILAGRAERVLVKSCMADAGFNYEASSDTDVELEPTELTVSLLTEEEVRANGYGMFLPESDSSPALEEKNRAHLDSLPESERAAWVSALSGAGDSDSLELATGATIPMGGCQGEAKRSLFGERVLEVYESFDRVQFLPMQTDLSTLEEIAEVEDRWAECMEESGHRFDNPQDAIAAGLNARGDHTRPTDSEIDIAVADASCRESVSMAETVEDVFRRRNAALLADNLGLITGWLELEAYVLDVAGKTLGVELRRIED